MARMAQFNLFDEVPDVAALISQSEGQYFDRKSSRIDAKTLIDIPASDSVHRTDASFWDEQTT